VNERRPPELRDLVGEDVSGEELDQLRRAHEVVLAAGPLPELPPSLQHPPVVEDDRRDSSAAFALIPRRTGRVLTFAAALAVMTLVIGYIVGNRHAGFNTDYTVAMQGTAASPHAVGLVRVGHIDSVGNWPLELEVVGLKQLPTGGYYTLYLTRNKKPVASCGTFRVHEGRTVVRLNAPYDFRRFDQGGWVVAAHRPGQPEPGPILLRNSRSTV
jgi:hypothetical protein